MSGHQFKEGQATKKRQSQGAEKSLPRFIWADMRDHQVSPKRAACEIIAHVAEFGDRNQIKTIKLSGYDSRGRTRSEIKNFGGEIEKPQHVKQPEKCVSHRLQRLVLAKSGKHLARKNREQEEEQNRDFEIVRTSGTESGKIIKTPGQHDGATNHRRDFEIRQAAVIEHSVKLPERNQSEAADQKPKENFVSGKCDRQC